MPGENLQERLQTASELMQLLRRPGTEAPLRNGREEWTRWIKENLYRLIDRDAFDISPVIADSTKGESGQSHFNLFASNVCHPERSEGSADAFSQLCGEGWRRRDVETAPSCRK